MNRVPSEFDEYYRATHKMDVPTGHSVMLSMVQMDLATNKLLLQCYKTFVALHFTNVKTSISSRICNSSPLATAVVVANRVVVSFYKRLFDIATFRLLYTFHKVNDPPPPSLSLSLSSLSLSLSLSLSIVSLTALGRFWHGRLNLRLTGSPIPSSKKTLIYPFQIPFHLPRKC